MCNNFLIGVKTSNGWQVGYVTNGEREIIRQDRGLSVEQYAAAKMGVEYLESIPAAMQVNCKEVGIRVSRC